MNGYQRISAALRGEQPDSTPIMLHNFMMAAREAGLTMAQFRSNPEAMAHAFLDSVERYGFDGIMIDVDTVTLAEAAGVPVDLPDDEPARVSGSRISSLEEVANLAPVDLSSAPRVQIWLEATAVIARAVGKEIYVRGNCDQSPFSLAGMIRGMGAWMMDLLDPENEERAHALLEYATRVTGDFVRLMARTGAHMTSNGDSPAGPDLVSPAMYRRFALPYERRIVDESHAAGLPSVLHICGNTDAILADMVSTGADGLELDYKTSTHLARSILADRTTFIGNIDPSGVLALGTPSLVRQRTEDLLRIFADTPRFIINAGCAIPPTTPPDNLRAMIATARTFPRSGGAAA